MKRRTVTLTEADLRGRGSPCAQVNVQSWDEYFPRVLFWTFKATERAVLRQEGGVVEVVMEHQDKDAMGNTRWSTTPLEDAADNLNLTLDPWLGAWLGIQLLGEGDTETGNAFLQDEESAIRVPCSSGNFYSRHATHCYAKERFGDQRVLRVISDPYMRSQMRIDLAARAIGGDPFVEVTWHPG
jgi:hypothetical protein